MPLKGTPRCPLQRRRVFCFPSSLTVSVGIVTPQQMQFSEPLPLRSGASLDEATIASLIAQRAAAKAGKNFAEADRIRADLLAQGIVLKDSPTGTTWEAAS